MTGIEVSEPLNPSAWTVPQQQAVYDELALLLEVPPAVDLPGMTDQELSDYLQVVVDEIQTRPSAITEGVDKTTFLDDEIYQPQDK